MCESGATLVTMQTHCASRYPDTPGAYPESKTNWYWSNGGLYDQAHVPGYTTTASYTARSGQANLMQAGME